MLAEKINDNGTVGDLCLTFSSEIAVCLVSALFLLPSASMFRFS